MRSKILSIIMFVVLLAGMTACAVQPTAAPTPVPTAAPAATEAPATAAPAETKTVTVLAAASLTESFTELGTMFEAQNPGVKISFSFAGSQQLAEQLNQGADADVFASASKKYMTAAIDAKRVNEANSSIFATNHLVVIVPAANPAGIQTLQDLAKTGIKIDLAAESVPVGQYSLEFLDKASADAEFSPTYKENVLKNVVSYEDNVKAVLTKVSLGEADAGIVYLTDITADAAQKVSKIEIPEALNTIATYPIASIANSKNPDLAE